MAISKYQRVRGKMRRSGPHHTGLDWIVLLARSESNISLTSNHWLWMAPWPALAAVLNEKMMGDHDMERNIMGVSYYQMT